MKASTWWVGKIGGKHAETRFLKLGFLALLACTIVNTWILQKTMDSRHTVLVPAGGISETLTISNNYVDERYLDVMANYVMNLIGSYTTVRCRAQLEELLKLYDSKYYPQALESYLKMADDVEYSKASSHFGVEKIIFKYEQKVIEVGGQLRQYIEDKLVERKETTYLIHYLVRDGRFCLRGIEEKK
jgi:type IV conjugative transfer system protein TraE